MKEIRVTDTVYEFLKDLQHELKTQDTDGQAAPRYWMVMEKEMVATPQGIGDAYIHMGDGAVYTLDEAVQFVYDNNEFFDDNTTTRWKGVDKKDFDDVLEFIKDVFGCGEEVWQEERDRISHFSGAFLTKRECQRHIDANKHHYCKPHTFAMTAYRNYELEKLLVILETMEL